MLRGEARRGCWQQYPASGVSQVALSCGVLRLRATTAPARPGRADTPIVRHGPRAARVLVAYSRRTQVRATGSAGANGSASDGRPPPGRGRLGVASVASAV